jgi:hypothetical protein
LLILPGLTATFQMKASLGYVGDKEHTAGQEAPAQDILKLCEAVIASGASAVPTTPKVSLQMLARFAFLVRRRYLNCLQ